MMKRYGRLWERICSRENIEEAADNAVKGRKSRREQMRFLSDRENNLNRIEDMLRNETYQFGPLKSFTVYEPKERSIHHPAFFPDKVLHHCLMNVLAPLIISKLSPDCYGSIRERGLSQACDAIKRYTREYADGYYLQIDIRHFTKASTMGYAFRNWSISSSARRRCAWHVPSWKPIPKAWLSVYIRASTWPIWC